MSEKVLQANELCIFNYPYLGRSFSHWRRYGGRMSAEGDLREAFLGPEPFLGSPAIRFESCALNIEA
jgi:hypothetical protein